MKLSVRVTPNARQSQILGWESDPRIGQVLKLRIAAPPIEGKANAAVRELLAQWLNLPKSAVSLDRGDQSRIKTFTIPDHTRLPEIP